LHLGVSRKTAWRDLHEARRKIADALVSGKGIEITGCRIAAEGRCPRCRRNADGQEMNTRNPPD
jgi:Fe2+ or Zn2+ uptake regulation protein